MTNKQTITQKLASAFLLASLASNLLSPQATGQYFALENSPENTLNFSKNLAQELAFLAPQAEEIKNEIEPLFIGAASFITPKSPPIAKKQIVVSKRWLFVTAYSSTPDQTDSTPFITASNTHVRDGIVAANFLRFGAKIRFPTLYGDQLFVVEDRMNSRYPYRVDIWMRSREEAKQFGAKIVPIEVIKEI